MRNVMIAAGIAGLMALIVLGGLAGGSRDAFANACANACYAKHNQCRITQKGSPACDAQLTRCLRGCGG
jgi:hypothetical protein